MNEITFSLEKLSTKHKDRFYPDAFAGGVLGTAV